MQLAEEDRPTKRLRIDNDSMSDISAPEHVLYESEEDGDYMDAVLNDNRLDLPIGSESAEDFLMSDDPNKELTVEWYLHPELNITTERQDAVVELLNQIFKYDESNVEINMQGVVLDGRHYDTKRWTMLAPIRFGRETSDSVDSYWDHSDQENLLMLQLYGFSDATDNISRQDLMHVDDLGHGENYDAPELFLAMMEYWYFLWQWATHTEYYENGTRSLRMQLVFRTEGAQRQFLSTKSFPIRFTMVEGERTLTFFSFISQILRKIRDMDQQWWQQYKQIALEDDIHSQVIKEVAINITWSRRIDDIDEVAGCSGLETNGDGVRLLHNDLKKRSNFVYDPPSIQNNCVFACIIKFGPDNDEVRHAATLDAEHSCIHGPAYLRTYCEIEHNGPLNADDIRAVSRKLKIGFQLYGYKQMTNAKFSCMISSMAIIGVEYAEKIPLLIVASHAWLLIPTKERGSKNFGFQLLKYRKCATCSKWFVYNDNKATHFDQCTKCKLCGSNYQAHNGHNCTEKKVDDTYKGMKIVRKRKPDEKATYDKNVYFADYETFTDAIGTCHVYAACVAKLGEEEVRSFYGPTSASDFAQYVSSLRGILVFYNGSNFDNLFLLTGLLKVGCKITKVRVEK